MTMSCDCLYFGADHNSAASSTALGELCGDYSQSAIVGDKTEPGIFYGHRTMRSGRVFLTLICKRRQGPPPDDRPLNGRGWNSISIITRRSSGAEGTLRL